MSVERLWDFFEYRICMDDQEIAQVLVHVYAAQNRDG